MNTERLEELLRALSPAPSEWVASAAEIPTYIDLPGGGTDLEAGGAGDGSESDALDAPPPPHGVDTPGDQLETDDDEGPGEPDA